MRNDTSHLFGTFLGLSLWGLYSGLFGVTIWTIFRFRKTRNPLRGPVIGAILAIYALNFVATVSNVINAYRAFVLHPTGAVQYFKDREDRVFNALANFIMITVTIVADATVAWRFYVIWNRKIRLLILPVLALVFGVVGGTVITVYDIKFCISGWFPAYGKPYDIWTIALYGATVVYNWTITALIVWRLRWADPGYRVNPFGPQSSTYTRVIIALIECGALYSVALIAFAVAFITSPSRAAHILAPAMPQVVGIVPVLICLQRALGYTHPNDHCSPNSSQWMWSVTSPETTNGAIESNLKSDEEYEMIKSKWVSDSNAGGEPRPSKPPSHQHT